jgi:hypothetical protein
MIKLGKSGMLWLRVVHVFFVSIWVGGAVALTLMQFGLNPTDGGSLYGIDRSMRFIDDFIIIPGAFGCLITGMVFSLFTRWGFFRYRWIIAKYIINIGAIMFGTFWLGPWLNGMGPISSMEGLAAFSDPVYVHFKTMNTWCGLLQAVLLLCAVYLSIFRPWGKMTP